MKLRKDYNLVYVLLAAVILVCFGVVVITGENGILRILELKRMKNDLASENSQLTRDNVLLHEEIKALHQPSHIERRVRELGWTRPGEFVFVDTTPQ